METKRGFWQIFYDELGIPVPERDTAGTRSGYIVAALTLWLPRPIRPFLQWPLGVLAFLLWVLVIKPLEALSGLVKRFANPS